VQNLNGNIAQGLTEPIIVKFARSSAPGAVLAQQPQQSAAKGSVSTYAPQTQATQATTLVRFQPYEQGKAREVTYGGHATPLAAGYVLNAGSGTGVGVGGGSSGGGSEQSTDTIWVGDLPYGSDEASIRNIFAAYGGVVRVRTLGVSNGRTAAIIQFVDAGEAQWIVNNLNGNIAQGLTEPIVVKFARAQHQGGGFIGGTTSPLGSYSAGAAAPVGAAIYAGSNNVPVSYTSHGGSSHPPASHPSYAGSGNHYTGGGGGGGHSTQHYGGSSGTGIRSFLANFVKSEAFPQLDQSQLVQIHVSGLPSDTTDLHLYRMFVPFGCPIGPNGVKAMLGRNGQCTGVGFVDVYDVGRAQMVMQALNGTMLPDGTVLKVQPKRENNHQGKAGWAARGGGGGKGWGGSGGHGHATSRGCGAGGGDAGGGGGGGAWNNYQSSGQEEDGGEAQEQDPSAEDQYAGGEDQYANGQDQFAVGEESDGAAQNLAADGNGRPMDGDVGIVDTWN